VKNLQREFKIRKQIKIILVVVAILGVLSVILYGAFALQLQGKGVVAQLPAAPLYLLGIGLVFLLPFVAINYFLVIRKSRLANVSGPFKAYVRRVWIINI
jgi:hypothetical protein